LDPILALERLLETLLNRERWNDTILNNFTRKEAEQKSLPAGPGRELDGVEWFIGPEFWVVEEEGWRTVTAALGVAGPESVSTTRNLI
jgi:hypothetical protein